MIYIKLKLGSLPDIEQDKLLEGRRPDEQDKLKFDH